MSMNDKRAKQRDADKFDTTSLTPNSVQAKTLGRDYSAHFFRWSFARRLIKKTDHVLDLGCGVDQPLKKILFNSGGGALCASYTGVDLNKLKAQANQHVTLFPETDFTSAAGFKKVTTAEGGPTGGRQFDVIVHLEIIEHMPVEAGAKLLANCYKALKPGGLMVMSTPVYDGKHHAANHIHEYTVDELMKAVTKAKFTVERRFGTFMDIKHIGKVGLQESHLNDAIKTVRDRLGEYFDNDALANIFGPLYPNHARNNLWMCRK
jgi:2-polyprenyl-3-methyl-5-hydroxy-6-metoxy-1,4-benzoquinol methylase